MKAHSVNDLDNFICGWYIDPTCCDAILEYFNQADIKYKGSTSIGYDKNTKDSTDCPLPDGSVNSVYMYELQKCVDLYIEKYKFCNIGSPWTITQMANIQHYAPGGGYHVWHTERNRKSEPFVSRHLVYLTYLNDVDDGGETEFFYQNVRVKPEKGLTLIWGSDWTFTHRGIPSPSQEKYVVTGWFNYVD